MTDVTMKTLAKIPVLAQLGTSVCQRLIENTSLLDFKSGEVIYDYGESLDGMYALVSGHVKLYRESGDRVQILALLRQGDCFGTEALSDVPASSYIAASLKKTQILYIPKTTIKQLMLDYPQVRVAILQLTTDRLRQFATLVHNLAFRDVTARLATVILVRAEEDGTLADDGIRVARLMTQSELATMVGTGREVILRMFKKLEAQNIIRVSRKEIIILDMKQLRAIAQEENR